MNKQRKVLITTTYNEMGIIIDTKAEEVATKCINSIPPVTPQPKIGKWIKSRDSYGNNHFTCPFCEHDIATKADTWEDNYCSNCGARLESEEDMTQNEIEDKEEISFRQWLFNSFGMTVEQFESSTTAYGKKFFHDQYFQYLSERNATTTGKAINVEEIWLKNT